MWNGFFLVGAIALVAGLLFWDQRRRHRAQRRRFATRWFPPACPTTCVSTAAPHHRLQHVGEEHLPACSGPQRPLRADVALLPGRVMVRPGRPVDDVHPPGRQRARGPVVLSVRGAGNPRHHQGRRFRATARPLRTRRDLPGHQLAGANRRCLATGGLLETGAALHQWCGSLVSAKAAWRFPSDAIRVSPTRSARRRRPRGG
jgi:hypothetical protein